MIDIQNCSDRKPNLEHQELPFEVFGHPQQVLEDFRLTTPEKRAVLAAWASDANAISHLPALRQLPDGSIVKLDDILRALKALDEPAERGPKSGSLLWKQPFKGRRMPLRQWLRRRRGPDDDDDPPPCPADAAPRPRGGGGAAFARAEPIWA